MAEEALQDFTERLEIAKVVYDFFIANPGKDYSVDVNELDKGGPDTKLVSDLGLDLIDAAELIAVLEDRLGIGDMGDGIREQILHSGDLVSVIW
ncbi:MAG: hypothetical protein KAT43_02215 [Nanoarchaeota archaeon]|nr:hypothetical protein [Nanoarchaeota archaeon]